ALASSRRTRTREFRRDRPCDWQATGMTDPRSGEPFTEDGAWNYIVEQLEARVEVEVIELEVPAGKKGYVMLMPSHDSNIPIYVKLQIGADCVVGRSFHYSVSPKRGGGNAS